MVININNSRKKLRLYIPPVTQLKTNISTITLDQSIPDGEAEITTIYGNSIKDENDIIHNFTATQLNTTQGVVELPTTTYFPNGMNSIGNYADEINGNKVIKRIRKIETSEFTSERTQHISYSYHTEDTGAPYETLYSKNAALSSVTYISQNPQCRPSTMSSTYAGQIYTKNTHWVINPENSNSFILTVGGNSYTYVKGNNVTWGTFSVSINATNKQVPSKSMNYVLTTLTKVGQDDNYYYYNTPDLSICYGGSISQGFHIRCDSVTTVANLRNWINNHSDQFQIYTVLTNPVETEVTNNIKFPVKSGDTISINDNNSTPLIADINFYKFKKNQIYKVNLYHPYNAEIEYLRNNGLAYIKLDNISINSQDTIEVEFSRNSNNNNYGIIYRSISKYYFAYWVNTSDSYWCYKNEKRLSTFKTTLNTKNKLKQVKNIITLNDNLVETQNIQEPFEATGIYLFKMGNGDNRELTSTIYSFRITDNNNIVKLDLVPVRVGQVGYMYDKVSHQLFGNQGTGSFILGPDKQ